MKDWMYREDELRVRCRTEGGGWEILTIGGGGELEGLVGV